MDIHHSHCTRTLQEMAHDVTKHTTYSYEQAYKAVMGIYYICQNPTEVESFVNDFIRSHKS